MSDTISQLNRTSYAKPDVVNYYRSVESLLKTEKVLFDKLLPTIKNAKILDLGIGGGRTTKHLLNLTDDYTGVDYVPELVQAAAEKYAGAKILCADARNLSDLPDDAFDFALFSYNGLDSLSDDDRRLTLQAVRRVLKKNGIFMFSSHNRDYRYFNKMPWQRRFGFNPGELRYFLHCLRYLPNHYQMKKHEIFTDDYAVINDGAHKFSLLLYHIGIEKQIEQLTEHGFGEIEAYDAGGNLVASDTFSLWIYYLAKKI